VRVGVKVGVEVDVGTVVGVNVGVGTSVWLTAALAVGFLVGNNIEEGDTGEHAARRVRRNEKQGTGNKGRSLFMVKERGICPMITEKARPHGIPSHFLLLTRYSSLLTRYSPPL
jgi:hypothetical protein